MRDNRDVKVVAIQEGVKSIRDDVFRSCTGLITITIPSSVTSIGDSSFYGCTSLLAAAETKGFATVAQWGKHRWFCLVVLHRRVSVLASTYYWTNCYIIRDYREAAPPPRPGTNIFGGLLGFTRKHVGRHLRDP